jgi:dipeptidyl aminopeptidase/acylaminoacyl peptidase
MTQKPVRQFGLWPSPITPSSMAQGLSISDTAWDESGVLVWREQRSDRSVIAYQPAAEDEQPTSPPRDLLNDYSVQAKVGYGGGDFGVRKGLVYFVESDSGRIYRQTFEHGSPQAITPALGKAASPTPSPDGRWLVYVHSHEGLDALAVVDSVGHDWPSRLVSEDDFYMQPAWSPDGKRLAWVSWNQPNMPWDGARLHIGQIVYQESGRPSLGRIVYTAGGEQISVFQPTFSPDGGRLAYVSDESGWWQLHLYDLRTRKTRQLTHEQAEHGLPGWIQGMRTFVFSPDGKRIIYIRNDQGLNGLWQVDLDSGAREPLPLDQAYTSLEQISISPNGLIALSASGFSIPPRLITFSPSAGVRVNRRETTEELKPDMYSQGETLEWKGMDGTSVHGLFFPPYNTGFVGHGLPPLVVHVHSGPTRQVGAAFNQRAQFFTTRGYAFLEVNYRGSTGYGRPYRSALNGNWGIYDVQDAVSGAGSLTEQGRVDRSRMAIMGSSAGGFTVLRALEDYPGFFKAGVCMYGVSNLFNLAEQTHKFEASYYETLLGPLPESAELYRERSPIFFVDRIKDPLAVFQGEDDLVVPRTQSDSLVESLRRRGIPHEYHLYPGEGHGFRKVETIEHFYHAVEEFLQRHVILA